MEGKSMWDITPGEKKEYIDQLIPHLAALRAKADISQDELSTIIGVSRQTYGVVERSLKDLSWNTYLSLILFFDYNQQTHEMLHTCGAYPEGLFKKFNPGVDDRTISLGGVFSGANSKEILDSLDDQALNSIRTMVMVEYARCAGLTGDAVLKAFDGIDFKLKQNDAKIDNALASIRRRRKARKEND